MDQDRDIKFTCEIYKITDVKEEAFKDTELIFITVPASVAKKTILEIEDYISRDTKICFYPGTGGIEFCRKNLLNKNCIIFGTQRACSVARLEKYGHKVRTSGKRKEMYLGTLNDQYGELLRSLFEMIFEIKNIFAS